MALRIVLCDDSEDDQFFFKEALKKTSIVTTLTVTNDGEELLEYLNNAKSLPDAIFLDLNMPRMNGMEALSTLKKSEKFREIRIIIFTTTVQESAIEETLKAGADFYIAKPADLNELKEVINKSLLLIKEHKYADQKKNKFVIKAAHE